MRFVLTLLLLIPSSSIYAQAASLDVKGSGVKIVDVERTVIVKDKATVVASFPFTVTAPSGAAFYDWKYPAGVVATDDEGSILEVTSAPKGECTISVKMRSAKVVNGDVVFSTKTLRVTFTVGDVPPGPKPPDPKPPEPSPAPIPVDGFRVLIVHESADNLTPAQKAILTAQAIRQYLNAKCVKGPDGVTSEARIWDKDTDVSGESKLWQDAMKRPRTGTPWIIISTGKAGHEGPLPATVAETLALLKKWGGE